MQIIYFEMNFVDHVEYFGFGLWLLLLLVLVVDHLLIILWFLLMFVDVLGFYVVCLSLGARVERRNLVMNVV